MERRRKVAIRTVLIVVLVALGIAAADWVWPPAQQVVSVDGADVHDCFTIHLVDSTGATTGTVQPPCLVQTNQALRGDRSANTTGRIPVPITLLQRGNATCPEMYFARYRILSGSVDGFSVNDPFRIDLVTPPSWDVVNF